MANGFIFVNPHDQQPFYRTDNIRNRWETALRKAGGRYRPPGQMRHTYASTALTEGEVMSKVLLLTDLHLCVSQIQQLSE